MAYIRIGIPKRNSCPESLSSPRACLPKIDVEFGMVVNIKGAKNQELSYCIDHPGILDADGNRRAPFDGTVFVKTNDWDFYLGDTIWDPINDKLGSWRMALELKNQVIAEKVFELFV